MSMQKEPLVSVLTPVYNGEAYLSECIESVIAQTYSNWEYVILNNCSTDRTLEIAEHYVRLDKRISVHSNETLVPVIANHNTAFRLISAESKYCKVVSADDWLFPECLARMVNLAEENPSVGIVGSYQLSGGGKNWGDWQVRWDEIPYPSPVTPGREVCRRYLLGGPGWGGFGTPTSILYRSDLVRRQHSFYPNPSAEADTSACCKYLRETDYGFVHQVLSYERVHRVRMTSQSQSLNAYASSMMSDLLEYGSDVLSKEESTKRRDQLMSEYYEYLSISALKFRDKQFWKYHEERLKELGYPLSKIRLVKSICVKMLDLLLNPKHTAKLIGKRFVASKQLDTS